MSVVLGGRSRAIVVLGDLDHRVEKVVQDFEHCHNGKAHAQTENTSAVGHEPNDRNALIAEYLGHNGLLDVDVDEGEVLPGVVVHGGDQSVDGRVPLLREHVMRAPYGLAHLLGRVEFESRGLHESADAGIEDLELSSLPPAAGLAQLGHEDAELRSLDECLAVGEARGGHTDLVLLVLAGRKTHAFLARVGRGGLKEKQLRLIRDRLSMQVQQLVINIFLLPTMHRQLQEIYRPPLPTNLINAVGWVLAKSVLMS